MEAAVMADTAAAVARQAATSMPGPLTWLPSMERRSKEVRSVVMYFSDKTNPFATPKKTHTQLTTHLTQIPNTQSDHHTGDWK